MKPLLKRVHSPDCGDVATFRPADPERFGIVVQLLIGPDDGDGEESFDVVVCTTEWIADRVADAEVLNLRHHLVVDSWNWDRIRRYVDQFLSTIEGQSWLEVAAIVSRLGRWEFEDYSHG